MKKNVIRLFSFLGILFALITPVRILAETNTGVVGEVNTAVTQLPVSFTPVRQGEQGEHVKEVQGRLYDLGFLAYAPDGDFGNNTEQAVIDFQKAAGLETTGIVDEETYKILNSEDAPEKEPGEPVLTTSNTAIMYATTLVNVRTEPDFDAALLGSISQGDAVLAGEESENGWTPVVYPPGIGYVYSQYLSSSKITENNAATRSMSAAAYQPTVRTTTTYTLTRDLWVRDQPNGNTIGTRDAYETVEVYGFVNGWAEIEWNGGSAYISADYIQKGILSRPQTVTRSNNTSYDFYSSSTSYGNGGVVWIPTHGGSKYHSSSGCSGMINPRQVSEADARAMGFERCGRCW